MFDVEERERVRERLVERAHADNRIVSAALVGSLALGEGDRWSDIDLSLGIADEIPLEGVLEEWTRDVVSELDGVVLFDLRAQDSIYRVFLLAGWLQIDLSFTPASRFRQGSPRFRLLFGTHKVIDPPATSAQNLFGWAVIYARHAHVCVERRRWWQAEYCVSAVRDHALMLACLRRGLPPSFGRGFDDVPAEVVAELHDALVRSLDRDELLRALHAAIDALLREAIDVGDVVPKVEPQLRELAAAGRASA